MTNSARTPARADHSRPLIRFLLAVLLASVVTALFAAPAGAVVTEAEGVQVGLQPRSTAQVKPAGTFGNEEALGRFRNDSGNAVVTGPTSIYFVYWDPGAWYHHEWTELLDQFGQNLSLSSGHPGTIFHALTQYRDRANAQASYDYVFEGAYSDTQPYPASGCTDPDPLELGEIGCLTDAQIRTALQSFIASHATRKGMNAIYYVITPPGVSVCLGASSGRCSDYEAGHVGESFCSYHGAINPDEVAQGDGNTVLYAAIPWVANFTGKTWDFLPAPGSPQLEDAFRCQEGAAPIEEPNQSNFAPEEGDYSQALADVIVNQIAVEQANIVTDPLLASWQNNSTGAEATDECRDQFGATAEPSKIEGNNTPDEHTNAGTLSNETVGEGLYYINNVVDNGFLNYPRCVGGIGLVPRFTSPARANSGEVVAFDGMESTVSEYQGAVFGPSGPPTTTYANFTWNFGDGTSPVSGYAPGAPVCEAPWLSPCAASVFHSYTYGGTYNVTLTVTDVAGNVSVTSHLITVAGPPPPPPPSAPSPPGGGSTSGPSGSGASGSTSGGSGAPIPAPEAKAAVASHSLRSAVRKGLAVSYSVNEQVAGRFEVLMAASLAKKLRIAGAPAAGLPAGTPPQVVIAHSVLVTTKGGRSTVHIKFSKSVAARLKHTRKATVMLRLVVRNAASSTPQTATVLSSVTLAG